MTAGNLTIQDNDTVDQYTSVGEEDFVFNFPVLAASELRCSVNQVELVYGAGFTITSGLGEEGGGVVNIPAGTTAGDIVTLWLDLPIERETGFTAGAAAILPTDLNTEFIRGVRTEQMLRREIRNAIRLRPDDPVSGLEMYLPALLARAGKYLAFNASGEPVPATGTGNDPDLREDLADGTTPGLGSDLVANRRTPLEIANGVTPINYATWARPIMDISRYVSDNEGGAAVHLEVTAALKASRNIIVPEGIYLLGAQVNVPALSYPLNIEGTTETTASGVNGAIFRLATAAGAGAACFYIGQGTEDLNFSRLAFQFQTKSTGQIGIRGDGDWRGGGIRRCSVLGSQAVGTTVRGFQFDGNGTYDGPVVLEDIYLNALLYGIDLQGSSTVVDIHRLFAAGYVSGATSYALRCGPESSYTLSKGHIEGWTRGVKSEGAYMFQEGVRYETNTANWEWTRGAGNARIWGMSIGERFLSGGAPVFPVNNEDLCFVVSGPAYAFFDLAQVEGGGGFLERLRSPVSVGQQVTPTFDAAAFTASASTWTVTSPQRITLTHARVGTSMTITWQIVNSTIGGTPTGLRIAIPLGITPAKAVQVPCVIENNGVFLSTGLAAVDPSKSYIEIFIDASGANPWTTSAQTGTAGQITFPISG